jgi:hypothetical protein
MARSSFQAQGSSSSSWWFLRRDDRLPRAIGRIVRSAQFGSTSARPSLRNSVRPSTKLRSTCLSRTQTAISAGSATSDNARQTSATVSPQDEIATGFSNNAMEFHSGRKLSRRTRAVRAGHYGDAEYVPHANDEIVVSAMIETKQGRANLDAISATPDLDAV